MRINYHIKKIVVFIFILNYLFCWAPFVRAAGLTSVSLAIGDNKPFITTNYTVNFTAATDATIKKIKFGFQKALDNANKPATLDLSSATNSQVMGINPLNWTYDSSSAASGILSLNSNDGETVHAGDSLSISFGSIRTSELGDCTTTEMIYDVCYLSINTYSDLGESTPVDNSGIEYRIEDIPSLTFSIEGVEGNLAHNGITTTNTSTYNQINFGSPGINQPVFMAHKLFVKTTAPHGYLITMKLDGYIQGLDPNNQITPFLPTNGAWNSPQLWVSPEGNTNSGSGWVGANTSDSRIDQYLALTNIWSSGNGAEKFGPVSSTAHPVMYSPGRDRDGTEAYVTYGIEANEKQPPDAYAGIIQYNLLATY